MCGLVGAVGGLIDSDRRVFRQLLIFDEIRGRDSTGVACITTDHRIFLEKEIGHPLYLLDKGAPTHPFIDGKGQIKFNSKILIGHNRAATVGEISEKNAHPFQHGHIVGAHNGTLTKGYLNKLEDHDKFEVDSEAVIYNISLHGAEAIKNVCGAYALVWYDSKQKKLFFIRNDKRPLYYTRRKDGDVMYWASESWMLNVALAKEKIEHVGVQPFDVDHLYSIDCNKLDFSFRKATLEKGEKIEGFTPPTVTTVIGGRKYSEIGASSHAILSSGLKNYDYNYNDDLQRWERVPKNVFKDNDKVGKKEISDSNWDLNALRQLEGTTLEFTIEGENRGVSNQLYLRAKSLIPTDTFEIRIFDINKFQWKKLANSKSSWKAKVKRAVRLFKDRKTELYVILDMRTIEPAMTDVAVKEMKKSHEFSGNPLVGFGGAYLSIEEWYRCTSNGCAWCSTDADIATHDTLHWLDHNEFICGDCMSNSEVRKYVGELKDGN